jgi:glyoxylase-like metal-dependent hydrolase (beta-lactamase superfamily II)
VERYAATDEAPAGVEPFAVPEVDETLWWLPEQASLVVGDVLLGADGGIAVCPDSWLDGRSSPTSIRTALQPLLDLPLERILTSHGEPVLEGARDAVARALR